MSNSDAGILAERMLRDARKALGILEGAGHGARLAGGCVRDRLLGLTPKDYDVATTADPQTVIASFRAAGFKTVPTGLDHGTVTVVMPSGPVEVTTLRVDVATDGRHAEVAFGTSFEEDAARRDFTINAMFEDRDGTVHDYWGGKADLSARCLRFVGDPGARIREDYLRILRFYRFWARLGFAPDPAAVTAITKEAAGLSRISQERITSELLQILAAPSAPVVLDAMATAGVWSIIAPELTGDGLVPPDLAPALAKLSPVPNDLRPLAALATLVCEVLALRGAAALNPADLTVRLKLSRAEGRRIEHAAAALGALATLSDDRALIMEFLDAAEQAGGEGSLERFFAPVLHGVLEHPAVPDRTLRAAALARAEAIETRFHALRRQRLPLSGDDLMRARPDLTGKALGGALVALKRAFRNGLWLTPAEGLAWLGVEYLPLP